MIVQNADVTAKRTDYAEGQIRVSSLFRTLQGESPFAGYPAVFLRLAGCNFGTKTTYCQFCDTSFQLEQSKSYSEIELLNAIKGQVKSGDILVLTGGEPSLQEQIVPVLVKLLEENIVRTVQIESNLTNPRFWAMLDATGYITKSVNSKGIYVVGSPKLNYVTRKVYKPANATLAVVGALKFLYDTGFGITEYVPEWALEQQGLGYDIYVSPVAVYAKPYEGELSSIWEQGLINKEATAKNYTEAAKYAIANSFKLSLQTHLFAAVE